MTDRLGQAAATGNVAPTFRIGEICFYYSQRLATRGSSQVHLTANQVAVIKLLSEHIDDIVRSEELLALLELHGGSMPRMKQVHVTISRLRRRLNLLCGDRFLIITIKGRGYMLCSTP